MIYQNLIKPIIDRAVSFIIIIIILPIFILLSIILMVTYKGNPFFLQARPGRKERIFYLLKFKTMNDKTDFEGNLLPDNERLTQIGKVIRRTSLDEVPQFFNVLKGDMSLVGPRPLLEEYLPIYNDFQRRRHEAKPGITGWAQINGRNAITWDEKFKFDVWYVDNLSFILDIKILFRTIRKVFRSEDINCNNITTMVRFSGNN
jgi:undecaprenyl phosphate N,N'-diacetylbacillosamine 1-phosphate transferase